MTLIGVRKHWAHKGHDTISVIIHQVLFTLNVFEWEARSHSNETRAEPNGNDGPETMISETLRQLAAGRSLSREEADAAMEELLEGRLAHADIVVLLTALRDKGETVDELVGFARAMRRHAFPVFAAVSHASVQEGAQESGRGGDVSASLLVDTCGTGGDGGGTFNVSTAAAFVAAGAGARVAKHGNRSFSSRTGSADVLEALGVNLDAPPARAAEAIQRIGIGFLFAPMMHTAMRHAAAARREAGGRTVFNLLGPLTNPAGAGAQVIGVPAVALVDKIGHALAELDVVRAFVVHGTDGIDEISLSAETEVADVRPHMVQRYRVTPEDFGVARAAREPLAGGDAATNAGMIRRVLEGEPGARRDFVCVNAAAALVAAGVATNFHEGTSLAAQAIDSGAAMGKLEALIAFSRL
jgi:anthranilate phosphoribosyltransferase